MQKTSRGAQWLAAILLGLVVVGIGGLFVGLRPYWVARYRGRRSNLQGAMLLLWKNYRRTTGWYAGPSARPYSSVAGSRNACAIETLWITG
jgi:hypothetical protein